MKRKRNARKKANAIMLSVLSVLFAGLIGTTYAYYTTAKSAENTLVTAGAEVYMQEYFNPSDLWLPGETKTKSVYFANRHDSDQVIRFTVEMSWYDNKGTPVKLNDDTPWTYTGSYNPAPAIINWTGEIVGVGATWTKIGNYYYYNKVLQKRSGTTPTVTPPVISSVTFSPALSNDDLHAENFSDKACKITIKMEALRVNTEFAQAEWNVKFTAAGNNLTWTQM